MTIGDALPGVTAVGEVVFDNDRGVEDTLRHLSALGHRRVTVLSWAVETSPGRPAERAVAEVAASLGLDCRIVPCAYSLNGSRPLALELLSVADRPTAMFCLSDSIAYGVCVACAELGLAIPADVSVAGFGEHPISRLLAPPLTSTTWDVERVATCGNRLPAGRARGRASQPVAPRDLPAGPGPARVDGPGAGRRSSSVVVGGRGRRRQNVEREELSRSLAAVAAGHCPAVGSRAH